MTALITLAFPDATSLSRFVQVVTEYARHDPENGEFVTKALANELASVPATQRVAALFIGGRKQTEGQLPEMNKRFIQEVNTHSANVELRELHQGVWRTIRSRKFQLGK